MDPKGVDDGNKELSFKLLVWLPNREGLSYFFYYGLLSCVKVNLLIVLPNKLSPVVGLPPNNGAFLENNPESIWDFYFLFSSIFEPIDDPKSPDVLVLFGVIPGYINFGAYEFP